METEKSCKNCAYFHRYYTLIYTHYRPTENGFCGNSYVREATFQKNYPTACKRWEQSTKRERVWGEYGAFCSKRQRTCGTLPIFSKTTNSFTAARAFCPTRNRRKF